MMARSGIMAPTQGMRLLDLRQYYLTHIRPVLAYGCGAWFTSCCRAYCGTGIPKKKDRYEGEPAVRCCKNIKELRNQELNALRSLQGECLAKVAGSMPGTGRLFLERELWVEDLPNWLSGRATSRRGQMMLKAKERQNIIGLKKAIEDL